MDTRFKLKLYNENAISHVHSKSIHQRNKSTPALNTLASGKSLLLNPLRRAAFADVSNTRNAPIKEEHVEGHKSGLSELKHFGIGSKDNGITKATQVAATSNLKSHTLLHPLQPSQAVNVSKAASAAPVKSEVIASKASQWTASNTTSTTALDHITFNDSAPVRKTLIKRHTTIFRETSIGSTAPRTAPVTKVEDATARVTELPESSPPASQVEVEQSQSAAAVVKVEPEPVSTTTSAIEEKPLLPTSSSITQASVPVKHDVLADTKLEPTSSQQAPKDYLGYILEESQPLEPELFLPALETQLPPLEVPALDEKVITPQAITDLEEYWVEEAEEEFFDAEGCVTARSFRSMVGENTTSGLTTVMMPAVTSRVERELAAAKAWVDETGFSEITDDEVWDTTMVTEYGDDIFIYMRELENRMMPNAYYMDSQAEIQWSMRSVLVDWVIQVHARFGLLPETLFLAINCIDRFLSVKVVSLAKLQLVGATAIYVAAKYEEINCPSVQEIAYMVDGSYTIEEILKAERFMLTMLKFEMGWPGPMSFLRRISKADDYDVETRTLAKYFLEVTLMDERFVGCVPSFLAAGSHCLARLMLGKGDWGAAHVHFSQYTYSQLKHLMSTLLDCCLAPKSHHVAVYEKFMDKRYKCASTFVESEMSRGFDLPQVARESIGGNSQSQSARRK